MSEKKYASDKPKNCRYCYWWGGRNKGCELGKENCYYLLPDEAPKKPKSRCDSCPYGRVHPCIGYCLIDIMARKNEVANDGTVS